MIAANKFCVAGTEFTVFQNGFIIADYSNDLFTPRFSHKELLAFEETARMIKGLISKGI